ncbi:discoidin domain-containing protein [Nostoc sp.]|uniref:discoidin domain-containing protein n=1 Tax=Nostoc sp. TaxID=1180 RepID=UPI002FFCB166
MPLFPGDSFQVPTLIKTTLDDSDYVLLVDPTGTLCKITKANFLASLSSADDNATSKTYVSVGDNNGIFYFIGTSEDTSSWVNPTSNGLIIQSSSIGSGSVNSLVDRSNSSFYTNSDPNSFVSFFLGGTRQLKCNYYTIKTRADSSDYYPRNWNLQGSNDGSTWVDLDIQINNTALNSTNQWLALPVSSDVAYSYFRIYTTGDNSAGYRHLVLGEVELYGKYSA